MKYLYFTQAQYLSKSTPHLTQKWFQAYTMNSKLANAHRHMRPIIYGDRVSMAGRWKF